MPDEPKITMGSVLDGAGATLRHVSIQAGTVASRHDHPFEQFLYVASGGGTLHCDAGPISLAPGVSLHLEPGAWHSAVFDQDTVLIEINLTDSLSD